MASKHTQDNPSGYMDGIRVKISEKYKPPPRINLPISYQQRLTLNKQIQESIPEYNFILEKTVQEKMLEWRTARSVMLEEQKKRLEEAKIEERKRVEKLKETQEEEVELNTTTSTTPVTSTVTEESTSYLNSIPSHNYQQQNYSSPQQHILIPTQVNKNTYSNILTPIPLTDLSNSQTTFQTQTDKSPFNISEFEADTSSPFDNMELKTINDMEELAQVLTKDRPVPYTDINNTSMLTNYNSSSINQQTNYNYPTTSGIGNNYSSYNIPNSMSYMQSIASTYNQSNGYYYPPVTLQNRHSSFNAPYSYSNQMDTNYITTSNTNMNDYQSIKTNSVNTVVPDILKSLNEKLNITHIDNTKSNISSNVVDRGKTSNSVHVKMKKSENLDDPYESLPKNLQDVCKSISLMGFPLDRVARVCKVVGNDEKKIVDHLLAMSELLVLGFPENNVSKALIQCNNDRDKALDLLTL